MSEVLPSPYVFSMASVGQELIAAFHEDHKTLGRDLHTLSLCLRSRNLEEARRVAEKLDRMAGAHIAFEEDAFYPLLKEILGAGEVERLYREHERGCAVVQRLCDVAASSLVADEDWAGMVADTEAIETHIAECGELFAAIDALPESRQRSLYRQLGDWRRRRPKWRDVRRCLQYESVLAGSGGAYGG